jgi:hypothetical protein
MPSGEFYDDPEEAYRRGFQQGAFRAVEAVDRLLGSPTSLGALRKWVDTDLSKWRLDDTQNRNRNPPEPPSN